MTKKSRACFVAAVVLLASVSAVADEEPEEDADEKVVAEKVSELDVKPIKISLADAVESALAHHPLVTEVEADAEIAEIEAEREDGRRSPVFALSALGRQEAVYNEFPLGGAATDLTRNLRTFGLESSITGRTSFGGVYQVRTRSLATDDSDADLFVALTPRYFNEVAARWTQPLLRGAGTLANAGRADREELNALVIRDQGREQLQALALDVVTAYWSLVLRREELRILRANLASAATLREVVKRRVKAGSDARTSLVQADATVAERRQAQNAAMLRVIEAESQLLRVSYLTKTSKIGPENTAVPSETFRAVKAPSAFKKNLRIALESRPEVKRARNAVRLAELDEKLAGNDRRFRLDLYGDVGVRGLAGTSTDPNVPIDLDGGIARSLRNLGLGKAPFFEFGIILEIPLDNDERRGAARQAALRLKKSRAVDVETQIGVDVRAALRVLEVNRQSLAVAKEALDLAEQNVAGQERRYQGGGGTLFDVLRAQDERSEAEGELVLARAQNEVAVANLDAARGTLLKQFNAKPAAKSRTRKRKAR